MILHTQITLTSEKADAMWEQVIRQKIENQARALSLLGLDGDKEIWNYAEKIGRESTDMLEAQSAKCY